ncbi:hypothetical protein FDP41_004778 [Naegleria fowleri]|uniref:UDP-N-acetylglucosamine--dolichyl-phosphate N-acetylglucosaminephosphotransferase n=1 Tax=Naegleria fowleri TaxID=5763 RepID=A0A6A5BE13_NAEFO|nr:uncharacterized protein FDP41_004778 [Naegleria fowleri]KAF0976103.1 hypothetical protein FDP41_004778 [Naegleria fowleri]CAG4710359.1 unnamed protein product [Naegleria fowleri]
MSKLLNMIGGLALIAPLMYMFLTHEILRNNTMIQMSILLSIVGYFVTLFMIPSIKGLCEGAGLWGKDLNKGEAGQKMKIPESLGIVPGVVYIVCVCFLQEMFQDKTQHDLYIAGLFCTCFMLFLGFADDVLELRWRYKLILPTLASLPLLTTYSGLTAVVIPKPLRAFEFFQSIATTIGDNIWMLELGILYKVYMLLVSVFCTNTINILAGINGLEVGQSVVIGLSILLHNFIEFEAGNEQHLFSIVCIIPFIAVSFGLLYYNWYPSEVFVGDTFTYFAGMTLAVTGIMGHFSKTLMLFLIPQWLNFLISLPQLFKIIPCPRHRIPKFNQQTGLLESSKNWTLLNLILEITGPLKESTLTYIMIVFQVLCCALGFYIRYIYSTYYYD